MATYILKRKLYALNPQKLTLSDVSIELGIQFPEALKRLSNMEKKIPSQLHYWAVQTPGIYMVAPSEVIYTSLTATDKDGNKSSVAPVLMDAAGNVLMYFNAATGKFNYNGVDIDDENAMVSALITELDRTYQNIINSTENPEANGGEIEAIKQQSINYQVYRDMVAQTFGLPTLEQQQQQMMQAQQGQ